MGRGVHLSAALAETGGGAVKDLGTPPFSTALVISTPHEMVLVHWTAKDAISPSRRRLSENSPYRHRTTRTVGLGEAAIIVHTTSCAQYHAEIAAC